MGGRSPADLRLQVAARCHQGQQLDMLFAEHLRHDVRNVFTRVVAGERIRQFETEATRPDGLPLPVSLSMCRVSDLQSAAAVLVIVRDG